MFTFDFDFALSFDYVSNYPFHAPLEIYNSFKHPLLLQASDFILTFFQFLRTTEM